MAGFRGITVASASMAIDTKTYVRRRPAPVPPTPAAAEQAAERETAHRRRMLLAGPIVAFVSAIAAVLATGAAGVPLRDPDGVASGRFVFVLWVVGGLIALDLLVRARQRTPGRGISLPSIAAVRRERWTLWRGVAVLSALISFYITYLAYRNLKSVLPLLRPGDLFDAQLADVDRTLFAGSDPAALLHDLMGTGFQAHAMSGAYMLFFLFIPGTLAAALVFSRDLQAGLFYVTAQSMNWLLGAASYYMLPALGPIYYEPSAFSHLPASGVTRLQDILLDQRLEFLRDPATGTAQSIAAFSSLHVSIFFTAALAAHVLGLARPLLIGAWALFGATVLSTVYLGWHYFVDDLGGLVIGAVAVVLARALTGLDRADGRKLSPAKAAPA
jgi:hypothetical protein